MDDRQLIHRMRRELLVLKGYVLLVTALLCGLWFTGFTQKNEKTRFAELDVERLNIVQADGKYCFVLTNGGRAPGAIIGGKEIVRSNSNNAPSIVFYNEEGDESGALMTAGRMKNDGSYYGSSRLVFDRFRRDETLAFQYYEDALGGYSGMLLQDTPEIFASDWIDGDSAIRAMPDGPAKDEALKKFRASAGYGARRMFVGKERDKSVGVTLADGSGHTRLRMLVDSTGSPRLEFLDDKGEITHRLPEPAHH